MQVTSLTPSQLSISNTRIVSEPPLQRSCLVLSVKLFVPLLLVRASLRLTLSLLSVSFFFRCRPKRAGLPLSPRSLFLSPGLCWRGVTLHSLSLSLACLGVWAPEGTLARRPAPQRSASLGTGRPFTLGVSPAARAPRRHGFACVEGVVVDHVQGLQVVFPHQLHFSSPVLSC